MRAGAEICPHPRRARGRGYDNQGEGFTNILIAKIQWGQTHKEPCEAKFVVKGKGNAKPVGSVEMRQQVNEAIRLMKQDRRMGTKASFVCVLSPSEDTDADFDMTVKEVVRILYLSGAAAGSHAILDADTVTTHVQEASSGARRGWPRDVQRDCRLRRHRG